MDSMVKWTVRSIISRIIFCKYLIHDHVYKSIGFGHPGIMTGVFEPDQFLVRRLQQFIIFFCQYRRSVDIMSSDQKIDWHFKLCCLCAKVHLPKLGIYDAEGIQCAAEPV